MTYRFEKLIKPCFAIAIGTAALFSVTTGTFAATNGTLGATSTGTSTVSLSIGQRYQITGVADLAFGSYSGTGDMLANDDVCIYTNGVTSAYKVRVLDNSSMSATGFSVQNTGATAQIPYTVKWNNVAGVTGNAAVAYNVPTAKTGANTTSVTCNGTNNANVQVVMMQADLQAAPAGSYSTTLSITIEP